MHKPCVRFLSGLFLSGAVMFVGSPALAGPTAQINIPSTDAKALKEVAFSITSYTRFSPKADAGTNLYAIGVVTGLLPYDSVKLEVGADYSTSGSQADNQADNHPISFNAKLATAEDVVVKGMPAFAVGIFNMGTYDKPEIPNGMSTRQNIAYGLVAKTVPVIGRLSLGGYYGSERALATAGNPRRNNIGIMASWDRMIDEVSDKLWLGVDYMGGNNANGQISFGAAWSFSKQVSLLAGVVVYNPFYSLSTADGGAIPGGKPALTTQLTINLP